MMERMLRKAVYFFQAFRFVRLGNFIHVFLGMVVVREAFPYQDISMFWSVFVIFGIFLYGGIYGLNNYQDYDADRAHAIKKTRITTQNFLSPNEIFIMAWIFIVASFIFGAFYAPHLLVFQFSFLLVNLLYTFVFKKIDQLSAALMVNTTHALRFVMGVVIAGGDVRVYWPYYVLIWSGLFILMTYKIQRENPAFAPLRVFGYRSVAYISFAVAVVLALVVRLNAVVIGYYLLHYGVGVALARSRDGVFKRVQHFWWNT